MSTMISRSAALSLLFALTALVSAQPPLPPLPPPDETKPAKPDQGPPGVTVAEKGVIHEAFAQPGGEIRGKEMTAPKAPPPPVNEIPPEIKPEGANVKWIPGYWAWDDGKNDFLWVSGFYRNLPPNREWEPGRWTEQDGKNVYLPGYWRPTTGGKPGADTPEPPKTLENGPSTPTDNPDALWVPGGWEYRDKQFVWRGGYWAAPYLTLMWQPPQYVYGGGGSYTYVPGYWDYPLEQRGLLNAPVYIDPQLAANPTFSYTPQYGIGLGNGNGADWGNGGLFNSMYIGPNYNNFYYGNYGNPYGLGGFGFGMGYGDPLLGFGGYYPWWFAGPGFYNPLWNHYNWLNRGNPGWAGGGRGGHNGAGGRGTTHSGGTHTGGTRTGATHTGVHSNAPSHTSIGGAAGVAGVAAQKGARVAATMQSNQIVRPSNQILASQSTRSTPGLTSMAGSNGVALNRSGVTIIGQGAGMTNSAGANGIGSSGFGYYHGLGSESFYRGAAEHGTVYGGGYGGYSGPAYGGVYGGYGGVRYGSVGGYRGSVGGFSGGRGGGGGRR